MKTVQYYFKDHCETPDDANPFETQWEDPELIADEVAEYAFHANDGWEWMGHHFEMTIIIDCEEFDFEVDVVAVPQFDARKKKNDKSGTLP